MDRKTYSLHLSRALDALGFSYRCIKQRQKSWEICSENLTADEDENVTDMIAGSKAEGVSRLLEGDYDLMVSLNDFVCYGGVEDMESDILTNMLNWENNDLKKNDKAKCKNDEADLGNTVIIYSRTGKTITGTKEETSKVHFNTGINPNSSETQDAKSNGQTRFIGDTDATVAYECTHVLKCELEETGEQLDKYIIENTEETNKGHRNGNATCLEKSSENVDDYLTESIEEKMDTGQSNISAAGNFDGVFVMDTDHVSPGYTKVKVLRLNETKLLNSFTTEGKAVLYAMIEQNGDNILSSERFIAKAYEADEDEDTETVAGPAGRSLESDWNICDTDSVYSIPCICKRINYAWANRKRKFDWPNKVLFGEISKLNGHIVPVGFKGSKNSNIEWRICYTMSEIKLVQSFNETQIKLHALLKMVGKGLLRSNCPDITSYILKNVLLWMAEKISPAKFEIENLYGLLKVALKFLTQMIRVRCLPNYMIPERNLFQGKLIRVERREVLKVLDELINDMDFFIEKYDELGFLSQYIRLSMHESKLVDYMEMNRLQMETIFRKYWREIWEARLYNFVPVCLEECVCLKSLVTLCTILGVSSKTKELVVEKIFWWITGRKQDKGCRKRGDEDGDINPYWCWNVSGDIIAYTPNLLSAEQLNVFFNKS